MIGNRWCIFLIDDDRRMRKAIRDYLARKDYCIIEAEDGEQAIEIFGQKGNLIDLILLDIMMPYKDGITVLNEMRELSQVPVILLTARDKEEDQIKGFRQGADDYIIKPFSPTLLAYRVESILRRTRKNTGERMQEGSLILDTLTQQVCLEEKELNLTVKEYELLYYLMKNKGLPLTREQILNAVWDFRYVGDGRTVDTHIKQLRAKLTDQYPYIKTVHRVGYKFEADR